MKFWKSLLSMALFVVLATSCGGNENILHDNYMEQEYVGCFNVINNSKKGTNVISEGTTYMFRWRSDFTADVYVYNAKFAEGMPNGINFAFEGLKWAYVNDVKTIYENDITPTWVKMNDKEIDVASYVLDELNIGVYERRLVGFTPEYMPIMSVSMTKGNVEVVTVQKQRFYFGTTAVVGESAYYPETKPFYLVSLNPTTKLASIDIYQAKFAEEMPAMDMKLENISFDVDSKKCELKVDTVIPSVEGVPVKERVISGLNGRITFDTGMDLRFNCMGDAVSAQLGFPIKQ